MLQHVLRCLCRGLQHLHTHGVINNDVKPQNVLVTPRTTFAQQSMAEPAAELANWLPQLPVGLRIQIGDLGQSLPADPRDRVLLKPDRVKRKACRKEPYGTEPPRYYSAPRPIRFLRMYGLWAAWVQRCLASRLVSWQMTPLLPHARISRWLTSHRRAI